MSNGNSNPSGQEALITAIGGAVGGLLSVLYSFVIKQPLFGSVALSILVSVGLGMFAALIVVFLTAFINRNNLVRLFVWALVIGFVWKPVVQAAQAQIEKTIATHAAETTKHLAAQTSSKGAELQGTMSSGEIKPKINDTLASAIETVNKLPRVKDEKTETQVNESLAVTADQFRDVAINNNDPAVAKQATNALKKLGEAAARTESYGVANSVSKSLYDVAVMARNKEVQGQAWSGKEKVEALNFPRERQTGSQISHD